MARIRWVEESEATGDAAAAYAEWFAAHPGRAAVPGILKCFSLRPDFFRDDGRHLRQAPLHRRAPDASASRR